MRSDVSRSAVLHQHMPHETELGLLAFALVEQPGLRIRGGGVRLVQAPLPMKVHFRVATGTTLGRRGVLGPKTLQGSSGLNESAVHGEMLVRQQSGLFIIEVRLLSNPALSVMGSLVRSRLTGFLDLARFKTSQPKEDLSAMAHNLLWPSKVGAPQVGEVAALSPG
jgi:hypothetical protein